MPNNLSFTRRAPSARQSRATGVGEEQPATTNVADDADPGDYRVRMRDRLLNCGAASLVDDEILEMLLFFAFKAGDTSRLARRLIHDFGSLAAVLSAPAEALRHANGLGPNGVAAVNLVRDVALRMARAEIMAQPVLNNWDRLIGYLTSRLAHEKVELFRVLFLNPRNRLIADEELGRGTVNHAPVYPREIIKRALELYATAVILVHNHPSGDPTPSREDIETTADIRDAAAVLGITVCDHIVIGREGIFSFRREGLLTG
jgi:DNA repair protein RadC